MSFSAEKDTPLAEVALVIWASVLATSVCLSRTPYGARLDPEVVERRTAERAGSRLTDTSSGSRQAAPAVT